MGCTASTTDNNLRAQHNTGINANILQNKEYDSRVNPPNHPNKGQSKFIKVIFL